MYKNFVTRFHFTTTRIRAPVGGEGDFSSSYPPALLSKTNQRGPSVTVRNARCAANRRQDKTKHRNFVAILIIAAGFQTATVLNSEQAFYMCYCCCFGKRFCYTLYKLNIVVPLSVRFCYTLTNFAIL